MHYLLESLSVIEHGGPSDIQEAWSTENCLFSQGGFIAMQSGKVQDDAICNRKNFGNSQKQDRWPCPIKLALRMALVHF